MGSIAVKRDCRLAIARHRKLSKRSPVSSGFSVHRACRFVRKCQCDFCRACVVVPHLSLDDHVSNPRECVCVEMLWLGR